MLRIIFLFFNMCWLFVVGQPTINERYIIDETTISAFTNVYSTDSCYYIGGIQTSSLGINNLESAWIRYKFDGTIDSLRVINNDTLGIGFWMTNKIIKTLDNNFASIAVADGDNAPQTFLFLKFNEFGDTLLTKYYSEFYIENLLVGKEPSTLVQISDSSYFGVVNMQRSDDLRAPTVFFRLSKTGELMFYKIYYGLGTSYFHILKPYGLVQLEMNRFLISTSLIHTNGDNDEQRHHTKLLIVDTLGNLIDEYTYWEDTLAMDCNGLTKTMDGGLIYCGRIGRFYPDDDVIGYRGQIIKLRADFTLDWKLLIGDYTSNPYIGLRNILTLNDSEFVMVGFMKTFEPTDRNQYGWLIKFNIDGEIIWERKYLKITQEHLAPNYPLHELYDVDITSDEGFVMVGQAINYYEDNGHLYGQKAWLLKTNRFGCLVPGCQLKDIAGENLPAELDTTKNPKTKEPDVWLYPNPASHSLYYYHDQENFQIGKASIYNAQSEEIQKWDITENKITYEIDISRLAAGTYFLKVFNLFGETIYAEKFIKISQ